LYEALEDLIVFEADKDDIGIDGTIQNEGFRYVKEKEWKSADIDRCKKTIALVNAKIAHAEGIGQPNPFCAAYRFSAFCVFGYYLTTLKETVQYHHTKIYHFTHRFHSPNIFLLQS